MDRIVKRLQISAVKMAIPAALLGVALLICTPLTRAQSCGYGTGHSCGDGGKNATPPPPDPPQVPEPGMLLQLGTGLSALAIVGRRLVARKS
jgi:hypothetical protein